MRFSITLLAATSLFGAADAPKVNFVRDVAPILNKAGCMSGTCHGRPKARTDSSSRCAVMIRNSITRRCFTIWVAAASIALIQAAA